MAWLSGTTTYILLILLTLFLYHALRSWRQKHAEDALAARHGCKPISAVTKGKWPWNLDLVKGLLQANAAQHILQYQGSFIDALGPNIEQRLLGVSGLVTLDPENVKAVLTESTFRKSWLDYGYGIRAESFRPLLGEGIFTQDGLAWKHSREVLRKQFARLQYSSHLDLFAPHVEKLVARLAAHEGHVVDLQPLFFDITLDTTTALIFGESANALDGSDRFGKAFDEASWITATRAKLTKFYWLYTPPRYLRACRDVKSYADEYVRKALDHNRNEKSGGEADQYRFIRDLYEDLGDRKLVRDQLVNVLLAGRDTTACCLAWAFRLLVRHRDVLEKLKKEEDEVMGVSTVVDKGLVKRMPYLRCVLNETLRLYPSVPINDRTALEPTTLPQGGGPDGASPILVRKDQGVGYSPYFMHRRKDLYGEDARRFVPERWEDGTLQDRIGWGYLPFNGGPRICLGQEFALLEASYAIVRILQAFPTISLPADEVVVPVGEERQILSFTLKPADGCRVQL